MQIRPYRSSDLPALTALFYDTVHRVNARDYTPRQLDAWASGSVDAAGWDRSLLAHVSLVALLEGQPVGFADLDPASGLLDRALCPRGASGSGDRHGALQSSGASCLRQHRHHPRFHHGPPLL